MVFRSMHYHVLLTVFIVCSITNSCNRTNNTDAHFIVEKEYANTGNSQEIRELDSLAEYKNGQLVLNDTKNYIRVHKIRIMELLNQNVSGHIKGKISNFGIQYICYKANEDTVILVNMYKYVYRKFDTNSNTVLQDNPYKVVINPLKGNNESFIMFNLVIGKNKTLLKLIE